MKAKLIKDRLFLKKIADNYTLHRIKDGILTIEGDSHYTIKGIHPFYKLSLKNCQAIELGYNLDEEISKIVKTIVPDDRGKDIWYGTSMAVGKLCFQKALSILGDKKFSEDDVHQALHLMDNRTKVPIVGEALDIIAKIEKQRNEIVQSLQQTEWDVTFNPDELDADGCLILKRI